MRTSRLWLPLVVMVCLAVAGISLATTRADAVPRDRHWKPGAHLIAKKGSKANRTSPAPVATATPTAAATPAPTPAPSATDAPASGTPTATAPPSPVSTATEVAVPMGAAVSERPLTLTRQGVELTSSYCGNGSATEPHPGVTTLVVVVHGDSRTACDQARYVLEAAYDRGQLERTLVVAPHFLTVDDAAAQQSGRLYWSDGGWKSGSQSLTAPYGRAATVSSYDVIDAVIERATGASVLPDLQRVVIAGHSAGGQLVNRYTASAHVGVERAGVVTDQVVANPSSYLYFDAARPDGDGFRALTADEVTACRSYNTYKYGLDGLYTYAAGAPAPLPQQYAAARVTYLLGALDRDPDDASLDTTCAARWQGPQRFARGTAYFAHLGAMLGADVYDRQTLTVVPGVGHSAHDMFTSPEGERTLFP